MARAAEESMQGCVGGRFDLHKVKLDKRTESHLGCLWMRTCTGDTIGAVEG